MQQRQDWYAYLGLSPDTTTEQIERAVERLSRQAASLAVTAPERSQLLRETIRSIKRDLLSGPDSRQRYDASRAEPAAVPPVEQAPAAFGAVPPVEPAPGAFGAVPPAEPAPAAAGAPSPGYPAQPSPAPIPVATAPASAGESVSSRISRFLRTGWTCSSCGKDALPSDKFCTRCGSPIRPVQPDASSPRTRPVCANCAAPLAARDAFCAKCGTPVSK